MQNLTSFIAASDKLHFAGLQLTMKLVQILFTNQFKHDSLKF